MHKPANTLLRDYFDYTPKINTEEQLQGFALNLINQYSRTLLNYKGIFSFLQQIINCNFLYDLFSITS